MKNYWFLGNLPIAIVASCVSLECRIRLRQVNKRCRSIIDQTS